MLIEARRRPSMGRGPDPDEIPYSGHFPFIPESHIKMSWPGASLGGRVLVTDELDDLEVVWNGGPLLPEREQHPHHTYVEPKRKYTLKQRGKSQVVNNPSGAEGDTEDEDVWED